MKIRQCVHCGFCCKVPCSFGAFNDERTQCKFLTDQNLCGRYEEIKAATPNWEYYPAFGAGCSSSLFNSVRDATIKKEEFSMLNDTDDPELFDVDPIDDGSNLDSDTKEFLDQEAFDLDKEFSDDNFSLYGDDDDDI